MSYNLAANSEYDYESNTVTIPISALARVGSRDFPIGDFWVGQEIRVDITFQPRWSQK